MAGPSKYFIFIILLILPALLFFKQDTEWLSMFQTKEDPSSTVINILDKIENSPSDDYIDEDPIIDSSLVEAEDDIDHPDLVAPRSYTGPYDQYIPGRKYLIYSPSGGFSNQRMEIEYAVEIGKLLNRTVYVPMCGRHTNGWEAYSILKGETDLFPMDRILDFPYLATYDHRTRLVPLNRTVQSFVGRFMKQYGTESVYIVTGMKKFYERKDIIKWRPYKQPLMYFRGPGFFHLWFSTTTMIPVRKHVRFTKYLRDLAVKVTQKAFGGNFYAMHIRMGDYSSRRTDDATYFVNRAQDLKWKLKAYKTYIATEPNHDQKFFSPLEKSLNVIYSNGLPKELVRDFKNAFPKGKIRGDMVGLLEQLICVQSKSFIGTYFSTFSAFILFMREHKAELFPELVDLDITSDGSAETPEASSTPQLPSN